MTNGEHSGAREQALTLDDVFQEFLLLADTPDASTLETMVAKYPQFAADLTDFAVEWAMQDLLPESAEPSAPDSAKAVERAMERLHEEMAKDGETRVWPDPFQHRTPGDLKQIGRHLGIDKTLLAKLRDRRIEASTIPLSFTEQLAGELDVPVGAMLSHLQAPPVLTMGASFKARGKPEALGKESFAEAVERAQLSGEEKQRLTDLLSDSE